MKEMYWGGAPIAGVSEGGTGELVDRWGDTWYCIRNYHAMPPFFIALVSGSEHWMFVSSTGGLTCGRRNPDNALFPYETDDRIHDAWSTAGPRAILRVGHEGGTRLWTPFLPGVTPYALERNLYKNRIGNKLVFEEVNHDLGLVFSYRWSTSERYGFVKSTRVRNAGESNREIEVLDGLRNLLPFGVTRRMQNQLSTLLDAYKQAERAPGLAAGVFSLSSILTDRAEPCEALKATAAWCQGLEDPLVLLSEDQLAGYCNGATLRSESSSRGKRSAFFVHSALSLGGGEEREWQLAADVNLGPVALARLLSEVRQGIGPDAIEAEVESGSRRLLQLVGEADGCQLSSDGLATARHFSNTLFNIMRGGTFFDAYRFPREDFLHFAERWNRPLRDACASLLDAAGDGADRQAVLRAAEDSGDPDLQRLALEYLPLTFSRRHGDPSRPWNQFSIDLKNEDGSDKLFYQGNWRDIFQNWEALSHSYPGYIESFVAKFVNASTVDGYNPYRITSEGIDWEVLDPEDSWSNIGYWGDHQVNYLLRLLMLSRDYHPGALSALLSREIFVYADVPYRIKAYPELLRDPRNTVLYDEQQARASEHRVRETGSDGKFATLPDGTLCRVNLLEKLLLPVLTKLGNFVQGGGIWMNTQRPEWNDANNALVGYGLSMVTLCYLRPYLALLSDLLEEDRSEGYAVSAEVGRWFHATLEVLEDYRQTLASKSTAPGRKQVLDALGTAASDYRAAAYQGLSGDKGTLDRTAILGFVGLALQYVDHTIRENRREDGLYHAYNLVRFGAEGYEVEHLYEMLEGQVAVLNSGCLGADEALQLLQSLRDSRIYRPDQNSYLLYPDRQQTPFLERNVIPPVLVGQHSCLRRELESGRRDLLEADVDGKAHFNPGFRNVADLAAALERRSDISPDDAAAICEVYEQVFRHHRFTGRSGSMFKYEGLGSIYWHMVSKLLLATAEAITGAAEQGADGDTVGQLMIRFDDIKDGIGFYKAPSQYGAVPTDPYSHTPGFSGVQQPGMTGQVKEDVITRFAELGVEVRGGQVRFAPVLLRREEFQGSAEGWAVPGGRGPATERVEPGCLAFSLCGVPVLYRLADQAVIEVRDSGQALLQRIEGDGLGPEWSDALFRRDPRIGKIIVDIPRERLR